MSDYPFIIDEDKVLDLEVRQLISSVDEITETGDAPLA